MVTSVVRGAWCVVRRRWPGDRRLWRGSRDWSFLMVLNLFLFTHLRTAFRDPARGGEHHCPYYVRNVRGKICRQPAIGGFLLTFLDFCWVARGPRVESCRVDPPSSNSRLRP